MLDLFFKKYVWIAYAVLIFAAAWLTARTVNTVVGAVIRPRPVVDLSARRAASPAAATGPRLAPERVYALIGATPPAAPQVATAEAQPARPQNCDDPGATPSRTALRAQLVGGVIADPPRNSIVSVTDLGSRETRIYGVGDTIQGARLIGVERIGDQRDASPAAFRMAAIVCNDGQKEYIDFESGGGGAAPPAVASVPSLGRAPVPAPATGAPAAAPGAGVKKTAENSYEVPRNVVDGALSNMSALATQARIVPSFKNGVANGFKLFSIQPNSLYANIGVENGDVIQRINGYEINSPDKALEVYQKLRESSHITIELERNGRVIRKEYNVTGP